MSEENKKTPSEKPDSATQAESPTKSPTTDKPAKPAAKKSKPRPRKPAPKKSAPKETAADTPTDTSVTSAAEEKKEGAKQPAKSTAAKKKPRPRKPAPKKSAPKETAADTPTDTLVTSAAEEKKEEAKQPAKSTTAKKKPRPRKPAPKKSAPKETAADTPTDTLVTSAAEEKKEEAIQPAKATAAKRKPRPRKPAPKKSAPKETAADTPTDTFVTPAAEEKKEEAIQPVKSFAADKEKSRQPQPAPQKPGRGRHAPPKKTAPQAQTTQKEAATSVKLLINADEPEEARIVLLENGKVESFHIETVSLAQAKSNIYKGRISSIEPSLQAVFVDMGTEKNGFLPFSEIHPEYYCKEVPPGTHWKRLNIQEVLKKGQEMLVQVVKETTGNKGASITTYLSMPGRYVVLMPGSDSHGISRQITDESRRSRLREIMASVKLPEEIGYIVRTASKDVTKTAMVKDIDFQLNLWEEIKHRGQSMPTPSLIYKEQDVISRFLRDHFYSEITEILVDNTETFTQVENFLDLLPARQRKTKVKLHQGARPIFNLHQIEDQIEAMFQPEVRLPSGGSIVINPTEALVAIDVNSGRTSKDKNFEETIFLANMEAAEELARQLRLRDLGGLIVVDFIDMRDKKHIRAVEKKVKTAMKRDKAKKDTSLISKFGLMQISRQRLGPPIQKGSYIVCQHCHGLGMTRSVETMALSHLRKIQTGAIKRMTDKVTCRFPLAVAQYLLNQKRADILDLERKYKVHIQIEADPAMSPSEATIDFQKNGNGDER